jgi:hypothetical protein
VDAKLYLEWLDVLFDAVTHQPPSLKGSDAVLWRHRNNIDLVLGPDGKLKLVSRHIG